LLISCIIPTRNRPAFVVEAARSVLAQSHAELELIMVNDGETPVPPFDDVRVRMIDSGQRGAVPARNLGVASAQGDAIAWLDDDDVWTDPNFLMSCVDRLQAGSDFIFGDGALVFPNGSRKSFAKHADAETLTRDNTILISVFACGAGGQDFVATRFACRRHPNPRAKHVGADQHASTLNKFKTAMRQTWATGYPIKIAY
jgi:hypothetical protein